MSFPQAKAGRTGSARRPWRAPLAFLLAALLAAAAAAASGPAPASALSPERGLELVSRGEPGPSVTAVEPIGPDGRDVVYETLGAFPDAVAGDLLSYNLAQRGNGGWSTEPIDPAYTSDQTVLSVTRPVAYGTSSTTSLWASPLPLTPDGPPKDRYGLYQRFPGGLVQLRLALGEQFPSDLDATGDLKRFVFEYGEHLLPSDAGRVEGSGIYELSGSSLRQVDVGADGQALSTCGSDAPGAETISESGSRIAFAAHLGDCTHPWRLFVREGGSQTREVSASACTRPDCNAPHDVTFAGATADLANIFMVTSQQLTNADEDEGPDLYRRSLADGKLTLLTPKLAGANGEVLANVVRPSSDGSRAYLEARGRLVPGIGSLYHLNLYLWQDGQLRFVAPSPKDQLATSADGRFALLTEQGSLSASERERPLLFSFDGSATTMGSFNGVMRIGIDQATGAVYALDLGYDLVDKFDAEGHALPFAASGKSSLNGAATPGGLFGLNSDSDISVDNSGTASQGRLYINTSPGPVNAFAPSGAYLWQLPAAGLGEDCGTAVDSLGHLWVSDRAAMKALQYGIAGSPPAQVGSVASSTGAACRLNLDRQGGLYLAMVGAGVDRYVDGSFESNLDPAVSQDVAIDQSREDGLIFTLHNSDFAEYAADGELLGTSGEGVIRSGVGIAYNAQRDWVYVSDSGDGSIKVFGPPVAGPVTNVPVEGADLDQGSDVYRYDAAANRLVLLSAGPGGASGTFDATLLSPMEGGVLYGTRKLRVLSDDGERAWFSTRERLLPDDGNEALDVYEWDAGDLRLISTGQGEDDAKYGGATPDGATVLFATSQVLLPADRDGGDTDVYAARIGGGFDESQPALECPAQPCQRSPLKPGAFAAPVTTRAGKASRGRLRVQPVPRDLVAKIVRSGRTKLVVRAPAAGMVSARALAAKAVLATGVAGATGPGPTPIVLTWTAKARARLAAGKDLRVRLRVRQGAAATTMRLRLKGARRR